MHKNVLEIIILLGELLIIFYSDRHLLSITPLAQKQIIYSHWHLSSQEDWILPLTRTQIYDHDEGNATL